MPSASDGVTEFSFLLRCLFKPQCCSSLLLLNFSLSRISFIFICQIEVFKFFVPYGRNNKCLWQGLNCRTSRLVASRESAFICSLILRAMRRVVKIKIDHVLNGYHL